MFSSGLFPDDILATAKQDIIKHENAPGAQGPSPVVSVSNNNMHIDIKPYFCLPYQSILKYRGMRCFPWADLPNSFARFSISRNVNKYGVSALAVSDS